MKISRVSSGCILGALLCFVIPTALAAAGATVIKTRNDDFSAPFSVINPCNGELIEGVIEGKAHLVDVFDSSGGEHVDLFALDHGTFVGDFGNAYVATQTMSGTGTATANGVVVITVVLDQPFISRGPADNFIVHAMAHFTITPNGTAVDFLVGGVECRG